MSGRDRSELYLHDDNDRKYIEASIMCALAGEAATYIMEGVWDEGGSGRKGRYESSEDRWYVSGDTQDAWRIVHLTRAKRSLRSHIHIGQ